MRRPLVASILAFMVLVFDGSAVSVAAPAIRDSLGSSLPQLQWVANGYVLALAASLLSAGRLADRLGPRTALSIGTVGFVAASVSCGSAPNIEWLIASRVVQGLFAALMAVSTYSLLTHRSVDDSDRRKAIGLLSASGSVAMAAGPVLSALVVESTSWRWIFYANLVVGVLVLAALHRVSGDTERNRVHFDVLGQAFAVLTLGAMAVVLTQGNVWGWTDGRTIAACVVAVLACWVLIVVERRTREPMIQLSLFRDRLYVMANIAGAAWRYALWGLVFFLGLYFHDSRQYEGLLLGAAFLPLSIGQVPASAVANALADRFGSVKVCAAGMLLSSLGAFALITVDVGSFYASIGAALVVVALGGGLSAPLHAHVALLHVSKSDSGLAAGVYNACAQTGALLGVASLGSLTGRSGVDGLHIAAALSGAVMLAASVGLFAHSGTDIRSPTKPMDIPETS